MRSLILFSVLIFISGSLLSQANNYYFGNLHAHTGFSDGNKDALSSGVSAPDGSYAFAKLSNNFNFLGISEHNHFSNNKNPGFKLPDYQAGLNMSNAANQEGTFLTLFGMEYGVASLPYGHVIIYGFNQLIGWETTVPGVAADNFDIYNAKGDYDGLFKKVKNNPNAFCYLAHPEFGGFSTDGTYATALDNAPYNAAYDSAIVGVPLRSGPAFSDSTNYLDYTTFNYFNYYKKLLYKGYHIGIGYDHDNHNTTFGRNNGGRLVIIAPSLTRANLTLAMKQMHFYGSDDSNAKIEFSLNGNIMGSIVKGTDFPTFTVLHKDPDGENADTIKIWKGTKNSGGLWADIVNITNNSNGITYTDYEIKANVEYYYFAEFKQSDGHWIVTSPIWYTSTVPLSQPEELMANNFNYFPNPVSKKLNISFPVSDDHIISIADVAGRVVFSNTFGEKNISIDLAEINPGIYTLQIKTKNTFVFRKLVVDP